MRTATRAFAMACVLSAAVLVVGCGGSGATDTKSSREVFLQPVAAPGPDPFTDSTAVADSAADASPVARTAQPEGSAPTGTTQAVRSISGSMPGLYAGTARVAGCDVDRQIDQLTSDPAKARAFAQAEGVSQASVPGYLRGLAPVVLRADTRVTNHGFRDGRATGFQSVLQAGTAVLVDNRGVPRVRCACGNPLKPAATTQGGSRTGGRPWSGYRPAQMIVVTPAPQVITTITIIDVVDNTWIERHIGHDVHHDHVVPPPARVTPTPWPTPKPSPDHDESGTGPSRSADSTAPGDTSSSPPDSGAGCRTPAPTVTVTPGATDDLRTEEPSATPADCATATVTAVPPTKPRPSTPGLATTAPGTPETSPAATDETGPEAVPDVPDMPDGGGLIPDDTAGSILDSPTEAVGS